MWAVCMRARRKCERYECSDVVVTIKSRVNGCLNRSVLEIRTIEMCMMIDYASITERQCSEAFPIAVLNKLYQSNNVIVILPIVNDNTLARLFSASQSVERTVFDQTRSSLPFIINR